MKFISKVIIAILLASILVVGEGRKITKSKRRTKVSGTDWFKTAAKGFLTGIADVSGDEINSCIPSSWQSDYEPEDEEDTKVAEDDQKTKTTLTYILENMKFALDVACIFVDQLKSLFGITRRRRRYRRVFITRKSRGFLSWCKSAFEWANKSVSTIRNWARDQWNNLKDWAVDKWNEVKTWAQEIWDIFWDKLKAVKARIDDFKAQVIEWVREKAIPIIVTIFKCVKIIKSIVGVISSVIKAVTLLMAGKLTNMIGMFINLVCNYQTIYDVSIFT
jgi:hypothetical protein